MQSTSGAKRFRAALLPMAPSTATTATPNIPTGQRASPTLTHTKLPTVIKALVFSFLDQASHVRAQLVANEWHDLARLPTALPADVRIRTDLQALAPYACNRLPRAFRDTLERSRSGAATPITVLSLAFNVDLNSTELQYLRAAIRPLSRLHRLALSGRSSETMGSWIIPAHLPHIDASDLPGAFCTSLRTLSLAPVTIVNGWNVGIAMVSRSLTSLTRLEVSVGFMQRYWPSTAPIAMQQQWKVLALLSHLQTLVLHGEHEVAADGTVVVSQWSVVPIAETERDLDDGRAVDERQRASIEREEAETLVGDAASLKDRSGDRRPRTAAAWSGVTELVLADFRRGTDMRPVFDLARHCPRLATLVFRDCTFSPRDEYEPRHQMIANLAAVRVECTRGCRMASGVGFARCHTTVASVEVRSFIGAARQCTRHEASQRHTLCARLPSVGDHGRLTTLAETVADSSLRAAAERPLTIRYYAPDFCECDFIDDTNLLFDRYPIASPPPHPDTD